MWLPGAGVSEVRQSSCSQGLHLSVKRQTLNTETYKGTETSRCLGEIQQSKCEKSDQVVSGGMVAVTVDRLVRMLCQGGAIWDQTWMAGVVSHVKIWGQPILGSRASLFGSRYRYKTVREAGVSESEDREWEGKWGKKGIKRQASSCRALDFFLEAPELRSWGFILPVG